MIIVVTCELIIGARTCTN